jgi:uncharacterized membrane protein
VPLLPDRPHLDLPRQPWERALETVALLFAFLPFAYLLAVWADLPTVVPTHFAASGVPDGWGPRRALWLLPGIGLVVYFGLSGLALIPHRLNFVVAITAENAERQYLIARQLLLGIKLSISILFGVVLWGSVQVAEGKSAGLGVEVVWVILAFLGFTVLASIVASIAAQ